jgi:1,4-dihydroxy-2-naphthoate octaprenyltransferase
MSTETSTQMPIRPAGRAPRGVKLWLLAMRAPFFTASIVPVVLGAIIGWHNAGTFDWLLFGLTLVGAVGAHAGANLANDYYDHVFGADEINTEYVRPFTGGSRVIQEGTLPPRSILTAALIGFGIGIACGAALYVMTGGIWIIILALIGGFCGVFYTAPPFRASYNSIGEVLIGLAFGVLLVLGAEYVQAGRMTAPAALASIPVALLIMGVLYINQFQDYRADKAANKRNWVVLLGRRRAVSGYIAIVAVTYLVIAAGVALRILPIWTLIGLAPFFVMGIRAIGVTRKHFDDPLKLVPANAATIGMHALTGLLLGLGFVIDKLA